ncbi:MAG: hypothetical protein ACQES9_05775 [Myxococcota bacterium]
MWEELVNLKPGNLWKRFKNNLDPDVVKVEAKPANLIPIILFFYSAVLILTFWQEYIDKKLVFIPLSFAALAGTLSFISYYCTGKSKNLLTALQLFDILFYILAILTVAAISTFPVSYLFLFIYVFMCHHYTLTTRYSELFLIIITLPGFIIFAVFKPDLPVEVFLLLNLVFIRHNFRSAQEKRKLQEDKEKSQYALDKLDQLLRETQSQMEISYKLSMSDNIHHIKNKILPISLSANWLAEKIEDLTVNAEINNLPTDFQQSLEELFSKSLRFEKRFVTFGKKHGTGVGLFLSQQITRTSRGELKVVESSNRGTVFQLNLPLYQDISD